MKRILLILAATAIMLVGIVAVAQAYGPGSGIHAPGTGLANGTAPTFAGAGYGMMSGRGGFGPRGGAAAGTNFTPGAGRGFTGGGPGMMGGAGGPGMMGGAGFGAGAAGNYAACPVNADGTFDPALMVTMAERMVTQHQALLDNLQARLAAATDDATKQLFTVRVEWQTIQLTWAQGRVTVAKSLPTDWVQAEIAMAQYDVDFFSKATATDAGNQTLIANRLAQAKERLAYFQAQATKTN